VLATVLFTDIVGSTERATAMGDRRWRELLEVHDELAGRLVEQFHGQLVKTTGDGVLATFDGPGRAIRCAAAFREQLAGHRPGHPGGPAHRRAGRGLRHRYGRPGDTPAEGRRRQLATVRGQAVTDEGIGP
jgi:class 3 adenylate cyclase